MVWRRGAVFGRVLSYVLFGLGVLLAVAIFVLSASGTARLVPVLSDSMAPDMPVGSLALTTQVPLDTIEVGDVIVFSNPNLPSTRIIHRVSHIFGVEESASFSNWSPDALFVTTKGDNNPAEDPWVVTVADPTMWKMNTSVPYLGLPAIWLAQPLAPLWLGSAGVLGVMVWILRALWRRPEPRAPETSTLDPEELS